MSDQTCSRREEMKGKFKKLIFFIFVFLVIYNLLKYDNNGGKSNVFELVQIKNEIKDIRGDDVVRADKDLISDDTDIVSSYHDTNSNEMIEIAVHASDWDDVSVNNNNGTQNNSIGISGRSDELQDKLNRGQTYHGHDLLQDPPYTFDSRFKNPCWFRENGKGSSELRCLPYVFIIGVKKCGTTDLFFRLSHHPDFKHPGIKECQFFARKRFKNEEADNIERYVDMFDGAAKNITNESKPLPDGTGVYNNWTITGEASPSYLHLNSHWKYLPGNENLDEPKYVILDYIHHFVPNAKILITFRDPIERLYSDYYHEYGTLKPQNSPNPYEFHQIVVKGIKLYKDCFSVRTVRSCVYDPSLYGETKIQMQLGIYYVFWQDLTRLCPRNQILILQNKNLRDKEKTLTSVFEFLGLRRLSVKDMKNIASLKRKLIREQTNGQREPMLSVTHKMLFSFYQPFNEKMADIMGDNTFLYTDSVESR